MRYLLAAAALAFASPASATGGFECRPVAGAGPSIVMTLGHTASARPVAITLREGGRSLSTQGAAPALAIGQSWVDARHLWLDLVDPAAVRVEAKLRAEFHPRLRGRPALGTLLRGGRSWRMRCVEG